VADPIWGKDKDHAQRRRPRPGDWTPTKSRDFFDHLAATANVRASARFVGMSSWGAYARRRRDPAFAAGWAEALQAGYDRLEQELVARALGSAGADEDLKPDDESVQKIADATPFDPELALKLLNKRGCYGPGAERTGPKLQPAASDDELECALGRKLAAVEKRTKAPPHE